jgi:uncharacterized protein (UPF0332 family)
MTPLIKRLLEERKLLKIEPDAELVLKEMEGSKYDIGRARKSLDDGDFKWATVQAYYAMFHLARALLYSLGYREKSHRALLLAVRELFVKRGELEEKFIRSFEDAMDLREEADYGLEFSEGGAERVIGDAEDFLSKVEQILKLE